MSNFKLFIVLISLTLVILTGGTSTEVAAQPPEKGTYIVRVLWKNVPLPGVHIEWHQKLDDAPALSGTTIRFGAATFRPASGSYYLTADWRPDGNYTRPRKPGDRFAWLGGNPLLVSSEISSTITLILEEIPPSPVSIPTGTGVTGMVTLNGSPAANIGIYAYAKADSAFKGNDFTATVRTNSKGEFTLELPPGRYYLLARLRSDNSIDLGPLHKGDLFGYDPGNPITVEQGFSTPTSIPISQLKMIKLTEAPTFKPGIIEGRIVDHNGQPVPGTYAALYDNLRMIGRAVFRSEPVGPDGYFRLSVAIPGKYYLGARSGYGGAPTSGGWFGAWDGPADHSITIKSGEVRSDIEIITHQLAEENTP
jgi:hypothetical protein